MITEHFYNDRQQLVSDLNQHLVAHLTQALHRREQATLILPGGSTPIPLFDLLAQQKLEWPRITLLLTDERWLASDHPDSNEGRIRTHILNKTPARFISLYSGDAQPEAGEKIIEQRLRTLNWPADICVLGMGEDGHIASLFAEAAEFAHGMSEHNSALCLSTRPPQAAHARLSLTLNALLNSREIIIFIQGENKKKLYESARNNVNRISLPVGFILHRSTVPIHIYWSA